MIAQWTHITLLVTDIILENKGLHSFSLDHHHCCFTFTLCSFHFQYCVGIKILATFPCTLYNFTFPQPVAQVKSEHSLLYFRIYCICNSTVFHCRLSICVCVSITGPPQGWIWIQGPTEIYVQRSQITDEGSHTRTSLSSSFKLNYINHVLPILKFMNSVVYLKPHFIYWHHCSACHRTQQCWAVSLSWHLFLHLYSYSTLNLIWRLFSSMFFRWRS